MTLQDIMDRLTTDGYQAVFSGKNDILLPGLGEIELAYGEAKIFDAKYAWPDYGNHQCHKDIEALFEDIHNTWPLEEPNDSTTDEPGSVQAGAETPIVCVGLDAEREAEVRS